jgi:uncharacterized membrane protein
VVATLSRWGIVEKILPSSGMSPPWHLYLMACLYILAGVMHFVYPRMYFKIIPDFLPWRGFIVFTSGIAEILLAMGLCFHASRNISVYGIISMLVLFLIVHFYMLSDRKAAMGLPRWLLYLRIPMQFALMYWAYSYLD